MHIMLHTNILCIVKSFFYNEIHSELLWSTEGEFWGRPWDATSVLLLHIRCHWPEVSVPFVFCTGLHLLDRWHAGEVISLDWPGIILTFSQKSWRRWLERGWSGFMRGPCNDAGCMVRCHTTQLSAKSKKSLFFYIYNCKKQKGKIFHI